jgi:hypothetical protein
MPENPFTGKQFYFLLSVADRWYHPANITWVTERAFRDTILPTLPW